MIHIEESKDTLIILKQNEFNSKALKNFNLKIVMICKPVSQNRIISFLDIDDKTAIELSFEDRILKRKSISAFNDKYFDLKIDQLKSLIPINNMKFFNYSSHLNKFFMLKIDYQNSALITTNTNLLKIKSLRISQRIIIHQL